MNWQEMRCSYSALQIHGILVQLLEQQPSVLGPPPKHRKTAAGFTLAHRQEKMLLEAKILADELSFHQPGLLLFSLQCILSTYSIGSGSGLDDEFDC